MQQVTCVWGLIQGHLVIFVLVYAYVNGDTDIER